MKASKVDISIQIGNIGMSEVRGNILPHKSVKPLMPPVKPPIKKR